MTDTSGLDRTCQSCGQRFAVARRGSPARYCQACRAAAIAAGGRRRWEKDKKYRWTPQLDELLRSRYDSHVRGRAREIAAQIGWPDWVIKRRAAALGIAGHWPEGRTGRRTWTPAFGR